MRKIIIHNDKNFNFNNALISTLPPFREKEEYFSSFEKFPFIDAKERGKSKMERFEKTQRLDELRICNDFGYAVDLAVSEAIRTGYRLSYRKEGVPMGYLDSEYFSFYSKKEGNTSAFILFGPSGIGKTTTLDASLSYYPQVITHKGIDFEMNQVTYIKVQCPPGESMKTFYDSCFDELEKALEYQIPDRKRCKTVDAKAHLFRKCAMRWNLGLLVIDEIQNLLYSKSRLLMNQFLNLSNEIRVPIIYCGTDAAIEYFENCEFFIKRRLGAEIYAKPYEKNILWDDFLEKMWEYQWLREYIPLTKELNDIFYSATGGIIERVIALFKSAQQKAIIDEIDTVEGFTPAFIEKLSKGRYHLTHDSLNMLADPTLPSHRIIEKDLRKSLDTAPNLEVLQTKEILKERIQKNQNSKKEILRNLVITNIKETSKFLPYQFEMEEIDKMFQKYYKKYRLKTDDDTVVTKKILELLIEEKYKAPVPLSMKKDDGPDTMNLPVLEGVI